MADDVLGVMVRAIANANIDYPNTIHGAVWDQHVRGYEESAHLANAVLFGLKKAGYTIAAIARDGADVHPEAPVRAYRKDDRQIAVEFAPTSGAGVATFLVPNTEPVSSDGTTLTDPALAEATDKALAMAREFLEVCGGGA